MLAFASRAATAAAAAFARAVRSARVIISKDRFPPISWSVLPCVALSAGLGLAQPSNRLDALTRAEAVWAERRPRSYEFTLEVRCFCVLANRPVSFRVTGNESELLDDIDVPVPVRRTYQHYDTVDKLFSILRDTASRQPFKWVVQFDSSLGYPVQADFDEDQLIVDDELFFRVTGFKPLRQ